MNKTSVVALLFVCTLSAPASAELSDALLAELRQGGYIIYMRHGPTNKAEQPKEQVLLKAGEFRLDDCSTQRNLSEEGRARLRQAGAAFRSLGIPVGKIVASRFCRTRETARLFYGEPEPADDLTPDAATGEPGRGEALRVRLDAPPQPGTNTLIVAHGGIMAALDGIQPNEGDAYVFRPGTEGEPHRIVGRIKLGDWAPAAGR